MAEWVTLQATDGHMLRAYVARPLQEPKAALIVVQEIFGVNVHIRQVADRYADLGFLVIAPAYFDRYERDFEVGYDAAAWERVKPIYPKLNFEAALLDTAAAMAWLQSQTKKQVGIVGYCFGGSVAWLSACRLPGLRAAVGYYGRAAMQYVQEEPKCPVMMHFGDQDESIPLADVKKLEEQHPHVPVYHYDAGHAFNRDVDPTHYRQEASSLALERTLAFFDEHLVS